MGINAQGGWTPEPPPAVPNYESCNATDSACVARNLVKNQIYQSTLAIATYGHDGAGNGPLGYLDQPYVVPQPLSNTNPPLYVGPPTYVAPYVPPTVPSTTSVVPVPGTTTSVYGNMKLLFLPTGLTVGDSWNINISGAGVGKNVVVKGGKNGAVDTTNMGKTDGNGGFSLSGRFDNNSIGSWHEEWYVDGNLLASLNFNVTSSLVTSSPTSSVVVTPVVPVVPQSQAVGLTSQVPTSTTQDTATNASMFDLFGTMDDNIMVPGTNIEVGTYTLAAVAGLLVLGFMMMSKKGRF